MHHIGEILDLISDRSLSNVTNVFRDFTQFLQPNAEIMPKLDQDRSLYCSFQFIVRPKSCNTGLRNLTYWQRS